MRGRGTLQRSLLFIGVIVASSGTTPASAQLAGLGASERSGSEIDDEAHAEDTHPAEARRGADDRCYAGPDGRSVPIPPGFNGSLGTYRRRWETRLSASVQEAGRTGTGRLDLGAAFNPWADDVDETRRSAPVSVVIRAAGFGFAVGDGLDGVLRGPDPSLGLIHRSDCDGYWIEYGVRALLPWQGSTINPSDFGASLRAVVTDGAGDDALWLPVNDTAIQLYGAAQFRSGDGAGHLYGGAGVHLSVSLWNVSVATWLGSQRGFVGSVGLSLFLGQMTINSRLGVRGDLSFTSLWPAGELLPGTFQLFFQWLPVHWAVAEVFVGGGGLIGSDSGEQLRFRWGLAVTFYVP